MRHPEPTQQTAVLRRLFLPVDDLVEHSIKVEVQSGVSVNVNQLTRLVDKPTAITHFTQRNVQLPTYIIRPQIH